jgi:hypothetical protein
VRKRVVENSVEIDKKEWDNIGKFLRNIYSTATEDMKAIAMGVSNTDNKQRALSDIDQIRKYSQAGDIPVTNQDASKLVPVLDKITDFVNDFLDSLSDVPDEL